MRVVIPSNAAARSAVARTVSRVSVHRHNGGAPLISPSENWWESGVTFNAAVVYLNPAENSVLIQRLLGAAGLAVAAPQGLVVVVYRARPRTDPGHLMNRSYVGVALFNAELELLHRFAEPVLVPDASEAAADC